MDIKGDSGHVVTPADALARREANSAANLLLDLPVPFRRIEGCVARWGSIPQRHSPLARQFSAGDHLRAYGTRRSDLPLLDLVVESGLYRYMSAVPKLFSWLN